MSEDAAKAFEDGVLHVLKGWTILSLAVEHGWGGRASAQKRDDLYKDILAAFYERRQNIIQSQERLADFLAHQMEVNFHVDCGDDLDEYDEVAGIFLKLATTLKANDFSFYNTVKGHRTDGAERSLTVNPSANSEWGLDAGQCLYAPASQPGQKDDSSDSDSDSEYADEEELIRQAMLQGGINML
ncbi:pre-rRNA-processing protein TSR2 [Gregarina niphandrodes]|uniref:Pre-rRNA-processing protein TSR2 n=1 Tax=Gregarina niphandrodes TaxID=110365 RepID=A0A023B0G8_GRENI|nr:pre-rRNA-processing protein TSR2 [Gregarina niphandrodes]EZG44249.1 pre-rRNA-processing protein TSR2 [Gregarina niphandrodes]|eukprot:XP_011132742.1 pre-rRNA-processing protein TSR2 [Gregarina niphandrodes]